MWGDRWLLHVFVDYVGVTLFYYLFNIVYLVCIDIKVFIFDTIFKIMWVDDELIYACGFCMSFFAFCMVVEYLFNRVYSVCIDVEVDIFNSIFENYVG